MTKKIITIAAFILILSSFVPAYRVQAISEEGIRDICRQEIAKDRELETPNVDLTNRVIAVERRMSALESLFQAVNNFLIQIVELFSKAIRN